MAKVTFGDGITDARNKLGAVVYARNRGGSYSRAYVLHNLSNTTIQNAHRQQFKMIMKRWLNTLTQAQRDAWNEFAARQHPQPKPISPAHRTGQNWHTALNWYTSWWPGTLLDDPPANLNPKSSGGFANTFCDTATLTFNIGTVISPDADTTIAISLTHPLPPAVYAFWPRLIDDFLLTSGDPNPKNFWTDYLADFATPVPGSRIGLRIRAVNNTNGVAENPGYTLLVTAT